MKIAFIGVPISGGGYSHFCYLKEGMKDIQFLLIGLGKSLYKVLPENNFVQIGLDLDSKRDVNELAKLFLDFVVKERIDIIIPMNSPIVVSVIPFLPYNCKVVQIVNSDTPRVYKYVTSHLQYVSKIICISKKQLSEIEKLTSADFISENALLIPHGVTLITDKIKNNLNEKLRIGFIGRMHQGHKNIFLIPEIIKSLRCPFHLELIGDGEDKKELIQKLKEYNIDHVDVGEIEKKYINNHLKNWDIQLFPSTVEGFGLTLIECMNHGIVPLSNNLEGITDYIITDRKDGFIIQNNKIEQYVEIIEMLNLNRKVLNTMKIESKATVKERFNSELIVEHYKNLFQEVFETPKTKTPKNFSDWKPYREYKPSFLKRVLHSLNR